MKNINKRFYTAPAVELFKTERQDVVSTSGFHGADDVFNTQNAQETKYNVLSMTNDLNNGLND